MFKSFIFVTIFFLMTSVAFAKTHHKKRHPKPKATPTSTVRNLRPEDLQWLLQ